MLDVFCPLNGGQINGAHWERSPVNTDASLNYTRQAHEFALMPYPQTIGAVQGLSHLFDDAEYAMMFGRTPTGPWTGALPNLPFVFPDMSGGLAKVSG
jgi:hypothetical protein